MIGRRRILGAGLLVAVLAAATGCGGDGGSQDTLTVYAASSLEPTFTQLGDRFEKSHPQVRVRFVFAGSSDLVAQLEAGADGDVLATADADTMASVGDLLAGEPTVFATNALQVAVPPDNPGHVETLADLAAPDLDVVVCAPQVPCGAAALRLEQHSGVSISPVSEEASVTDVLHKVASGEADAGLVYVTDVAAADGAVVGIDTPEAAHLLNDYPIATLSEASPAAQDFVDLVTGTHGQAVLRRAGFGTPPA